MNPANRSALERRVAQAADAALAKQQSVSAIDVLIGIGWLAQAHLDAWRHGRLPFLEAGIQTDPAKVSAAMRAFQAWAEAAGLRPSETAYVARSVDRQPLRFSTSGDAAIERAYRTHWLSPALTGPPPVRG